MTTIKGKLEYISFWHPINLETEDGTLDLRVQYFSLFDELNGKRVSMKTGMNELTIHANDDSEYELVYENSCGEIELSTDDSIGILLKKSDGWGMSNIGAYLPDALERLNGMHVIIEVTEDSISIKHDETEKVNEVYYTHGNSCKISDEDADKICLVGQENCCIFLTVNGDGFMCQKFGSTGRTLLDRHVKYSMRATRIGNCKIVGRKEY